MPYPPPLPLPVPTSMPPVPDSLLGTDLACIGLMNPEEELSNQQLNFTVRLPCLHTTTAGWTVLPDMTFSQSGLCLDYCDAVSF